MKNSNILLTSLVAGTLAFSGCGKKEEPVDIVEQKYQESINAVISDGGEKGKGKMDSEPPKPAETIRLLQEKGKLLYEFGNQEYTLTYSQTAFILIFLAFLIWANDGVATTITKEKEIFKREKQEVKTKLEELEKNCKNLKNANNVFQKQTSSLQKQLDELSVQNASLLEDIKSKTAFIQELEQNILPGLKVGSVAGDIVDSFQMMTDIIEQLRQKLEQAGNEEDIGNFIAYNKASVDTLFTEIELNFARFANMSENDMHLLSPVIALFQEAKTAYTKHMYKTAFEKAMQSMGILGYLENLQSYSGSSGTSNSSSAENAQSMWREYVAREGISTDWLSSDGGLIDFFAALEVDNISNWSSEFQKQVKKQFRKMASRYHPDKNQDINASENFRLAKLASDILGDQHLFQVYTKALAFYISNI